MKREEKKMQPNPSQRYRKHFMHNFLIFLLFYSCRRRRLECVKITNCIVKGFFGILIVEDREDDRISLGCVMRKKTRPREKGSEDSVGRKKTGDDGNSIQNNLHNQVLCKIICWFPIFVHLSL